MKTLDTTECDQFTLRKLHAHLQIKIAMQKLHDETLQTPLAALG
jgi:hypothetical protein